METLTPALSQVGRGSRIGEIIKFSFLGGFLLLGILVALPAGGHKVKTNNQVGAILHFEPSDQPKSLEPTQVWFALTKQGGKAIPLADCDCQLQIYQLPSKNKIMVPQLQPINAEKYQDIPSATVVFPQAGAYMLELSGKSVKPNDFKAFRLEFSATIMAGVARSPIPSVAVSVLPSTGNRSGLVYWAIGGSFLVGLGVLFWWRRSWR